MTLASPALVGERLLIRTEHRLYSIRRPVNEEEEFDNPSRLFK